MTGKSWTKNIEKDVYQVSPDDLKKEPQPSIKKRDFIRIYDKLREVIETTLPHSDKRHQLISKYSKYINPDVRIFRVEIQENDRRLTTMLNQLLDYNESSFRIVCDFRFEQFKKRNPFKMWEVLLPPDTAKVAGQGKEDPQGDDTDLGSYV